MKISEIIKESSYDLEFREALENILFGLVGDNIMTIETPKLLQLMNAQGFNASVSALVHEVNNNLSDIPIVSSIDDKQVILSTGEESHLSNKVDNSKDRVSNMAQRAAGKEF